MSHLENVGQYDYDKTKVLGHGAFAVVYKGFNTSSPSQCVAVKCISKKQNAKSKVLSAEEIKILKEVQHQNVVQFLDFKETDTHMYMVMEFCNGGDLAEYLRDKGALVESTLQLFVKQMAQALLAIHEKGVMHRDLKPGNILLCHNSALSVIQPRDIKLKIADFGFARFLNEEDMAATLCGSPIYMAPEVLMGLQYDARVDLWSLGTIIYQCYTGKAPFKANNPYHLRTFYEKSPTLQPMIPQSCSLELKDLILQLLQKNPDNRITFENLVKHKFLEIETELPGEKTPPYATPPQSQPIPVQSNFDRSSPKVSPGQSPGSSPSRWGSRSPSNSSTKLALMQKMRRSPREPMTPRNPVLIESTKSSAGTSAPPYFFIGQSPQSGTPPQPQSPLQLTFGETSPSVQSFALPPELTEITIMDEDQRELLDQFQASLRYCQAIREAAHLIENPFAVTDFKDKTKLGEKLVVCLKAESILSNTIHTAKQQLFAHNLSPSKTFKDVLYSVYGEFCAVHEMKLLLEKEVVLTDIACAEEILLGFALQQIRSGILDENFGHVKECLKRYRLSLALIIGLSTDVTSDHDRASLSRFESGLRHRLKTLTRQDFQWS